MTILSSLVAAYERMAERGDAPGFGYSNEKISFLISLDSGGMPVGRPHDLRSLQKNKPVATTMSVPQPPKRAAGISPIFLWDKTAYVLGITAGAAHRTAQEHQAFVDKHHEWLAGTGDEGLLALLRFLDWWTPAMFVQLGWPDEMIDKNAVFALESERLGGTRIHDRAAARDLWARISAGGDKVEGICLVKGERAPLARLHPSIKGVWGAQPAGASIVSFNLDAFTSYGKEQGFNAPVSEAAAFAYTTALNAFLKTGSNHRMQIGDASTVFWAHAPKPEAADKAENLFRAMVETVDEEQEAKGIGHVLQQIRAGVPLATIAPELAQGVRFHVLGLAPNAARLSIRFWYDNDFGNLAANYQAYVADIRLDSAERSNSPIRISSLVLRTAPARRESNSRLKFDSKDISPLLAGEMLRAILTDSRFPAAALANLIMRIRADGVLEQVRIAFIKAIIVRNMRLEGRLPRGDDGQVKEDYLVRSDPEDPNPARQMGRLFALIERAQRAALGDKINSTVKDKYLGAAAATPRQVLAKLVTNAEEHHLKRLRNGHSDAEWIKDSLHARRVGAALNKQIGELWADVGGSVPAQHSAEEQGIFLVGYYQERYRRKATADEGAENSGADDAAEQLEGDME